MIIYIYLMIIYNISLYYQIFKKIPLSLDDFWHKATNIGHLVMIKLTIYVMMI